MNPIKNARTLLSLRHGFLEFLTDTWHEKGDLVELQLGPRKMVMAIHPDQVKYVSVDGVADYDKEQSYESVRTRLLGTGLVGISGKKPLWKQQRRLMAPFFTPANVLAFAETMIRETQILSDRWETYHEPLEMLDEMLSVTAQVILKTMFSNTDNESLVSLKNSIEYLIGSLTKRSMSPFSLPDFVPTASQRRYRREMDNVQSKIRAVIEKRIRLPETEWPDDLLSRLLRAEEGGERMSYEQALHECVTVYVAGHETTARAMAFAWYALAQNPPVEARLHDEVDAVLGRGEFSVAAMHEMPYTAQVLKETLRLYPAAPIYIRDALRDNQLGGLLVQAGTPVLLSPFLTHRHPAFWDNPEVFDPERWTSTAEKARHRYAYHPFAGGERICIGINFSMLESHVILSILASRFKAGLTPADHRVHLSMSGTLNSENGIPMRVTTRNVLPGSH